MKLSHKRVAVLIDELYQEMEVWYPRYRLQEEGAKVLFVGPEKGKTYPSKLGYPATADEGASETKGSDFDALVIPGGFAPDFMRRNDHMIRLVREAFEAGKVIAAICHGPWMLCSVPETIKGRKVTCFMAIRHDVMNAGAEYLDREVVMDGPIITSRKPDDLPAFVCTLMDALSG